MTQLVTIITILTFMLQAATCYIVSLTGQPRNNSTRSIILNNVVQKHKLQDPQLRNGTFVINNTQDFLNSIRKNVDGESSIASKSNAFGLRVKRESISKYISPGPAATEDRSRANRKGRAVNQPSSHARNRRSNRLYAAQKAITAKWGCPGKRMGRRRRVRTGMSTRLRSGVNRRIKTKACQETKTEESNKKKRKSKEA